ncbi:restriction endonuclease subunit S [Xenorhabdus sp. Vera]|uniref:restriction endonuclease subunit S n=1 Tax=Xenorhabdus koppenhoeferi TaxID=351659 RepID=UPI0019AF1AD8|nr:restriction endonuclease subunit S [Xenorhabdus sp. Vera]MBD2809726.1 restriction endonuclease subunit S [Xenorhabdus sp. Vera]
MIFNSSKYNSHWQDKKLLELGTFRRGKSRHRPRNDPKLFEDGSYPLVQTGEVKAADLYIRTHDTCYNDFGLAQSAIWPKNTLCITIAANIAETALLGYPMCFPDSVVGFNAYPDESSELFMHYVFTYIRKAIQNSASGSIQDNINIDYLTGLKFKIPLKDYQDKIVRVLSVIDKKIELNNRINSELEAMAKTLYDYWFVQFDFPDANGKPYKTSGGKMIYDLVLKQEIPESWHACELKRLIDMEYGKSLKADNRTGYGYPVFGSSGIVGFHDNYLVEGPGIVIGRKGTIGKVNYVFDNFYPIDTTYYVRSKNKTSMIFLNFLLRYLGMEKMNSDSAVPGLSREAALNLSVVNIPLELINKFHDYVSVWFKKKQLICEENSKLIELRNWLLPMLMNGQVTVK